ncbi:hypothetical protein [Sphingomonas daechungensis]|uniref:hypothetical protein n=1 Tax=Sphingomonas daechungensis TaxID=1176646 RepID=UPI001CB912CC|nr:hypothetical protein [Sphingomonas daechungensis]
MARVIPFKDHALAHLRERLGVVEEANQDLIAFARGIQEQCRPSTRLCWRRWKPTERTISFTS